MTVTATFEPTYPIPGRDFKIRFAATHGNWISLWLTSCPPEAATLYAGFHGGETTRQLIGETDASKEFIWQAPVAGTYTFSAEEWTKGASNYGGSYLGDPDSFATETSIGSSPITVKVGQKLTVQLGSAGDTASLVLYVWDATSRQTTERYHGEVTPIVQDWTSEKARLAALNSSVIATVATMRDTLCDTIIASSPTIPGFIDELITKFNAHLTQATVHASNDTDNTILSSFLLGASVSVKQMAAALAEVERRLLLHMTNDSGTGPGSAATDYHTAADNKRGPVSDGAADARTVVAKLGDLRRVFSGHIAEPTTIHANADTTNVVTAGSPLVALHEHFFTQLATTIPALPTGEQAGVSDMIARGGFEKA